jgi:hypothetical protein
VHDLEVGLEGLEDEIEGLEDEPSKAQSNLEVAANARDVWLRRRATPTTTSR